MSEEGELEGLDIHEHGTPAYHMEFGQGMSYSTPSGLPPSGIRLDDGAGDKVETPV